MNSLRVSDPKIKILRVIARLNIGGPAIHVVLLSAGMDRVWFESLLVSGSENPGEGSMLDYALYHGVQPAIIREGETGYLVLPGDAPAVRPHCCVCCTSRR
jgi:hypothetical protein